MQSEQETHTKTVETELSRIQKALKVPKGRSNDFGGFDYRKAEDILEKVKEHLNDCALVLVDKVQHIEGRFYIEAIATLMYAEKKISVSAFAREPEKKTKMDDAQVTGASSSYARKYALCGLFAIDSGEDIDATSHKPATQEQIIEMMKLAAQKNMTDFKDKLPELKSSFELADQFINENK